MHFAKYAVVFMLMLTSCNAIVDTSSQAVVTTTPELTPIATALAPTDIPTVEATPIEPNSLTLWIPDVLFPQSSGDETNNVLNAQIAAFSGSENEIAIEVRRKRVREAGGILSTLRAAKDVAPGALPDITLLNREDLLQAVSGELVQPMEGYVSSAVIGNLYDTALSLGQVNNTLYGLPYTLEIQHVIYTEGQLAAPNTQFDTYLENEIPFFFPAAGANGLNRVFFVQYLVAGGSLNETGGLELNEEALLSTFQFYEDAVRAGLIPIEVLEYSNSADYRTVLSDSYTGASVVTSQYYLGLVDDGNAPAFAAIPTESGASITTLNGWMWVITTTDPNRQLIASAFLDWMMEADRQGEYARSLDVLPSQRTATRRWYSEEYTAFVGEVMENTTLPLADASNGAVARAMQSALRTVIQGTRTAEEATRDVINEVTDLG